MARDLRRNILICAIADRRPATVCIGGKDGYSMTGGKEYIDVYCTGSRGNGKLREECHKWDVVVEAERR